MYSKLKIRIGTVIENENKIYKTYIEIYSNNILLYISV